MTTFPNRPRRALAALSVGLVALGVTALPASAAVGCDVSSNVLTVRLDADDAATITKTGANAYTVSGVSTCSGSYTASNGIEVLLDAVGTGAESVTFAGFTTNPSADVSVDLGGGSGDAVAIEGSSGADVLTDAFFADIAGVESAAVSGYGGNDELAAPGGIPTALDGGTGDDTLIGGAADDILDGGTGGDQLFGGAGNDMASYGSSTSGVTVNLTTGVGSGGEATGDTLSGMEDIEGTPYDDVLTGNASSNFLFGSTGNDTLSGKDGVDRISAGDGNDVLNGGGGADELLGSGGRDTASYADAPSGVKVTIGGASTGGEASGDDLDKIENVTGSDYADVLVGDAASNVLNGGGGKDTLKGRGGNDTLIGGSGKDTASFAGSSAVTVNLATGTASGQGSDTLSGIENVVGSNHADTITGSSGANRLSGEGGNDTLVGGGGADVLLGGGGSDALDGGDGSDVCTGGDGADATKSCEKTP